MSQYMLNKALFDLTLETDAKKALENKESYFSQYSLEPAELQALLKPDFDALLNHGGLTNLVYRYYVLHGNKPQEFAERVEKDKTDQCD